MLGIWKCCAHWNGRVPDPDLLCEVVQLALPHKMCLIGAMSIELAADSGGGTRFDMAGVAGSTHGFTKQTTPARADVRSAEQYSSAGPSEHDSGIAEAMHSAYLRQCCDQRPSHPQDIMGIPKYWMEDWKSRWDE